MTTNNHEVIFAIINSGFAQEAMDVAREQGVRGGTIINARGVAQEEAAAFFGITIHAEKDLITFLTLFAGSVTKAKSLARAAVISAFCPSIYAIRRAVVI